jgi:gas vesicle protein
MKNFLAGVGLGALIGIIIAPTSGEETRAQLRDRAEQLGEQLGDRMRDMNEAGEAQGGKASDQDIAEVVGNMSRKAIDLQQSGDVKIA